MAQWTQYWRIITPVSRKTHYTKMPTVNVDDSMDLTSAGYSAFSTITWFTNLLKGATARLQRYKQYDAMDTGDVARALDVMAEEMSMPDQRTDLPFIIDYQVEENQTVSETTITTVRAALRHWSKLHDLSKKVFNTSRMMVKYGDCFFRKVSDTKKWEYIDPTRVIGIEINAEGEKVAYHIRPSSFQSTQRSHFHPGQNPVDSVEVTPAAAMIHFTRSDDMGESAPFGMSVLQNAFKDWQKLVMLEDSSVIYRIVRAPERRVWYIDTGNTPAPRVKQYLEQVKNDMRQRRMPNTANADQTDSTYNPESIGEDIFFPVSANGRSSRVEALPAGANWEIPELDYFLKKVFRSLRVPSSYMNGQDSTSAGSVYNDGKVGIAYMEERIFANFIVRQQAHIEEVFDAQFKTYLKVTGIKIDPDLFRLKLAPPQNFVQYQQSALDTDLISAFKSIEDTPYLSKRFMLSRFLHLSKDEILMNENMWKEENGIKDNLPIEDVQVIYDANVDRAKIKVDTTPEEPEGETPADTGSEGEEAPAESETPPEEQ